MARLHYKLWVQSQAGGAQDTVPSLTRYLQLRVYNGVGTRRTRINGGPWNNMVAASGYYHTSSQYQGLAAGLNFTLEYEDSNGIVTIATGTILAYSAFCDSGGGLVGAQIMEVDDSGIVVTIASIAGDTKSPYFTSIDGFVNQKPLSSAAPAIFSNAEIAAVIGSVGLGRKPQAPGLCLINSVASLLVPPIDFTASYTKTDVTAFGLSNGSIDVTVSLGVGPFTYLWNDGVTTQDRASLPAGAYSVQITDTGTSVVKNLSINITQPAQLTASISKTDVTTNGGSDGTANVIVSGGSGSYSFVWDDANTSQNRTGLSAGAYSVTVTDLVTAEVEVLDVTILEPAPEAPAEGDYLFVPAMNGITFVEQQVPNGCEVLQTMDNVLFCKQKFPGFLMQNYYQKVAKCDIHTIQFLSNYSEHTIEMRDYITNALVSSYSPVLKEQNTDNEVEEGVFITNHTTPGQSRVYFNVGGLPVPVTVGQNVEIFNNADGFDGNYAIIAIENDVLLGSQYLVINALYSIPAPTSPADARFIVNSQPFNVYEFIINDLGTKADGQYYFLIKGTASSTPREWTSEPIKLAVEHEGTNLFEYRNFDNAFDMTYTTGITNRIRVESTFFKRMPESEDNDYRNGDQSLVKLSAKRRRRFLLQVWHLPPYMHEKMSVMLGHDLIRINGVRHQCNEKYEDPKYITRYPLSNSQVIVEQFGWFDKYNSNDIGPVDGAGDDLIIANEGFIKI